MLEPSDAQPSTIENFLIPTPIESSGLDALDPPEFTRIFSPVKEKRILKENKDTTPINKRKCNGKAESPSKRYKHGDQQSPSVEPRVQPESVDTTCVPNIDVHPGGGHHPFPVSERLKNTFVIFDWDDTIFPSSYLAFLDVDYDTAIVPQCLKDRIFILESHILDMIEFVISMVGEKRVSIITNAEKGWITLSGQKFMPRLLQRVYRCNMVSARSTFEPFAPTTGPFEWKLLAFHMAAEVTFGSRFTKPTVHVMKPRLVSQQGQDFDEQGYKGEEDGYFNGDSSDSEESRLQEFLIHVHSDSQGVKDAEDNCIVQFSEDCLNSGEDLQGVSLSTTAAGSHTASGYGLAGAIGKDFLNYPSQNTETIWMPCANEFVSFPEVPVDYLKESGFDFVQAEDIDEVWNARKFIVSLGDSLAEKVATEHVASSIPNTTTKTLKYIDRPNLDQLVTQTILVRNNIQAYLEMTQALDIMIDIPEHDMTSFEQQFHSQKALVQNLDTVSI